MDAWKDFLKIQIYPFSMRQHTLIYSFIHSLCSFKRIIFRRKATASLPPWLSTGVRILERPVEGGTWIILSHSHTCFSSRCAEHVTFFKGLLSQISTFNNIYNWRSLCSEYRRLFSYKLKVKRTLFLLNASLNCMKLCFWWSEFCAWRSNI